MYKVYQVIPGETLEIIASNLKVNIEELKKLNGITDSAIIRPGSLIIIPNKEFDDYTKYIVKQGDSIYSIAKKYNADYQTLIAINGLKNNEYIYPNQEILIPSTNMYVTKIGDTIEIVLKRLNTTYDKIKSKNDEIYLEADQVIRY